MGIVLVIAASIAVAWGIRHHVMNSPRFGVKTIRVEGTVKRTPEQIAALAGVESGKNIFRIDLEAAGLRIQQDAWIDKANVTRRLPSTITIEVTEREAAAAVTVGSDVYLCTHEGELFKKIEPGDPSNLVVITGIMPEEVSKDRASVVKRVRGALDLLGQYERRGPNKRLPVQEIHLVSDGTTRMTIGKDAVTLELGRYPYGNKIIKAARVLDEVAHRNAEPSVVFLDNDAHPERVVVRMR
jgi:cell division protein FtsQ